jgi:protein-tyrosine kinase
MSYLAEPQGAAFQLNTKDSSIGRLLLESGKLTLENTENVLRLQKERGIRFGEAAVALGYISQADIDQTVARQFDYPYLQPGQAKYPKELVAAFSPFSDQVETLRALRSQLALSWFGTGRKSLAFVSLDQDPRANMLVANLAVVFSQLGEQTLLVDANLRQPQQQDIFNLQGRPGLSDLLAGRSDMSAIARIPEFVSLSVLPAGTLPPNPQEMLSRNSFGELDAALASKFEVVLYDTPASCVGADAVSLAARVGGVVILARTNHSRVEDLRKFRDQMRRTGTKIVASILLDF